MLLHVGADNIPHWEPQAVDQTGTVGLHTSMDAVDANTLFISYYDSANGDLKLAKTTDGGTSWATSIIESTGDVGQFSSLFALDANTVFVSYYDATAGNLNLRFAVSTNGGSSWTPSNVDTVGDVGQHTSIGAADANTIYISYYDVTNGDLKAAKSTDGGVSWTLYKVDPTNNRGQFTSLQVLDANTAYMSYYDVTGGDARFAKTTNGGSSWSNFAVTTSPNDVGRYTSIAAPTANTIFVSMYHVTNGDLRVNNSTDGGSTWAGTNVDTTGDVGLFTSIKFRDVNSIYATYYDATNGNLKMATTTNSGSSFTMQTLESTNDIGQYTSLAHLSVTEQFISYYDVTNGDLRFAKLSSPSLKLQYAARGSDNLCDTSFLGETYADVGPGAPVTFTDNPAPTDGSALTPNANDPTHGAYPSVNQTYEEANPFSIIDPIVSGRNGKWDFALTDSSSGSGTTFCLRAVKNDGTPLDTYSVIPQFTASTNLPPNLPTSLGQARGDNSVTISTGEWTTTASIRFSATVTDPDPGSSTRLCVEVRYLNGTLARRQCSGYTTSTSKSLTVPSGALTEGPYYWTAQAQDSAGASSSMQCFPDPSCNPTGERDFGIDLTSPSSSGAVVNDGTGSDINTQTSTSNYSANWSGFSDAVSGIARYEYQLKRDSDGLCWDAGPGAWGTCVWFSNGTSTTISLTKAGMLAVGESYTMSVRGVDFVDFVSLAVSSNGVTVIAAPPPPPPPPPVVLETPTIPPTTPPTIEPTPTESPLTTPLTPSVRETLTAVRETVQKAREALQASPVGKAVANVAPVAAPVATVTGTLVAIAQFLAQGPLYPSYLWTIVLEYLGLKRRRRSWGTVYNAETKDPLPMIVVQLVDRVSGQVVEQRVTDQQGRFGFLPKPGTYRIQANHPGYEFPSKIVPGKGDFRFSEVYHGEDISIKEGGTSLTVNIPLDPVGAEVPETARFVPKVSFRRASAAFLVITLLLQGFTVVMQPNMTNISLFGLYIIALILSRLMLHRRKPRNWAAVYDVETKEEVAGAEIYITEEGNPRFGSRRVTDDSGRAYLLLPPGRYHLFVNHPGYHFPIADDTPGYKGEVIVVTKENPLVHIDIPVKKEKHQPTSPLPAALVTPTNGSFPPPDVTPTPGQVGMAKVE